jgi:hypothetical protein
MTGHSCQYFAVTLVTKETFDFDRSKHPIRWTQIILPEMHVGLHEYILWNSWEGKNKDKFAPVGTQLIPQLCKNDECFIPCPTLSLAWHLWMLSRDVGVKSSLRSVFAVTERAMVLFHWLWTSVPSRMSCCTLLGCRQLAT